MENEIARKGTPVCYKGMEIGWLVYIGARDGRTMPPESGGDGIVRGYQFVTDLGEFDAIELVRSMPPVEKIHLRSVQHGTYGVRKLIEHFGINTEDYVEDTDIVFYVIERNFRSLTDVFRGDRRTWQLIKQRGLETKLFPELQPTD